MTKVAKTAIFPLLFLAVSQVPALATETDLWEVDAPPEATADWDASADNLQQEASAWQKQEVVRIAREEQEAETVRAEQQAEKEREEYQRQQREQREEEERQAQEYAAAEKSKRERKRIINDAVTLFKSINQLRQAGRE